MSALAGEALVNIKDYAPQISTEIRYAGSDNFVGEAVDGYTAPNCLLTPPAAEALAAAQEEFARFGLAILIYDCYRPQRAVDHFMRWVADPGNKQGRQAYYPKLAKGELVPEGYIAAKSGHSRGSTVDLTLYFTDSGQLLDMGTPWDFFDPLSNTENADIRAPARANRLLLRSVMAQHGFRNYPGEWWHFTLVDEPFPERYFDVPVR
ncbi:M15 family metallopeptidase [Seongchinamella sediminis]|nr:M15 family metallopeptidase [Seongchinamella sediminis]